MTLAENTSPPAGREQDVENKAQGADLGQGTGTEKNWLSVRAAGEALKNQAARGEVGKEAVNRQLE